MRQAVALWQGTTRQPGRIWDFYALKPSCSSWLEAHRWFWLRWGEAPTFTKNLWCVPLPGTPSTLSHSETNSTLDSKPILMMWKLKLKKGICSTLPGSHQLGWMWSRLCGPNVRLFSARQAASGALLFGFLYKPAPLVLNLHILLKINKEKTQQPNNQRDKQLRQALWKRG